MGPRAVAVVRSPFAAVPVGWDVTPLHLPCANVASLRFFLEPFDLAGATLTNADLWVLRPTLWSPAWPGLLCVHQTARVEFGGPLTTESGQVYRMWAAA